MQLNNAMPYSLALGIHDLSTRKKPISSIPVPTHLPKFIIHAEKGPLTNQLVNGDLRTELYGVNTFDDRKPYFNHQTLGSNIAMANGNNQYILRVIPDDAGPRANFLLSLDVLPTKITQYQRNTDGSIKLDVTGTPIPVTPAATIDGYKVKWVVSSISSRANETNFGQATQGVGDQVDGTTQSTRYPIMEVVLGYGAYYNNSGIRLYAPTINSSTKVDAKSLATNAVYPFRLSVIHRATKTASPGIVSTIYNSPSIDFTFKKGVINKLTDSQYSLEDIFDKNYSNTTDTNNALQISDIENIHLYQANIDTLTKQFYTAEKAVTVTTYSDFTGANNEEFLFNIISGVNSFNIPYYTFTVDNTQNTSLRLAETTNIYGQNGSDGTFDNTIYEQAVVNDINMYADNNSPYSDRLNHPVSFFYDTGFTLETKKQLGSFIALRKDTALVCSTYTVDGNDLSASDEHSIGTSLLTAFQMYPESEIFGTPAARFVLAKHYAYYKNTHYNKKVPLTLDILDKSSKMMGAANGVWKQEYLFDRRPNNEVLNFEEINNTFSGTTVRSNDWNIGLNWIQAFDIESFYWPAMKTGYPDDTSVLTSFFNMAVCIELQKVADRVYTEVTGNVSLTSGQLIDYVNDSVNKKVANRFAGLGKFIPNCMITSTDNQNGYSWTLAIEVYLNNMDTVQTVYIEAYRMADYTKQA